ncbi:MAG: helix-turn-helix domain-containing protein [Phycisphaerae bacterium]|nr:helix-turn-helix domain-containing protein [Phycisphaerae bacterium]
MMTADPAADAVRLENVRAYVATLKHGAAGNNFPVGRKAVADVIDDRETLDRWIQARRIVRQREALSGRDAVEERERCRRIVEKLATRLVVPADALESLMVELHDEPDDELALPEAGGELIDIEAVARRIGVSVASVRRLVDDNVLPKPIRLRRMVRWSRASIDDWLKQVAK